MKFHDERQPTEHREDSRPGPAHYEPPVIRVFTEEEILAHLGPAQLYTGKLPFEF